MRHWRLKGQTLVLNIFCIKCGGFFQFEIIINFLLSSSRYIWIPMLGVYGHPGYFYSYIAGIYLISNKLCGTKFLVKCISKTILWEGRIQWFMMTSDWLRGGSPDSSMRNWYIIIQVNILYTTKEVSNTIEQIMLQTSRPPSLILR